MVRNNEETPVSVSPEEFRAALEYIRAGEKKDEAAALAAERERLKLERERLALEREREKLRREQSRDRITEEPQPGGKIDAGGIAAFILSAVMALLSFAAMMAALGH